MVVEVVVKTLGRVEVVVEDPGLVVVAIGDKIMSVTLPRIEIKVSRGSAWDVFDPVPWVIKTIAPLPEGLEDRDFELWVCDQRLGGEPIVKVSPVEGTVDKEDDNTLKMSFRMTGEQTAMLPRSKKVFMTLVKPISEEEPKEPMHFHPTYEVDVEDPASK